MSAADIFAPGGLTWRAIPDAIDRMAKGVQHRATVAWKAVMRRLRDGTLDGSATDIELGEEAGWSPSLMQAGLHELDKAGLIERKSGIGMHGRRQIIPKLLAGRGTARSDPSPGTPPAPPPEDRGDTTTDAGSPSSSSPVGPGPEASMPAIDPALIVRARALLPRVKVGKVVDAILVHGADRVARALAAAEEHGRKPGNTPVSSWGFIIRTLERMKREDEAEAMAPTIAAADPPPKDLTAKTLRAAADAEQKAEKEREHRLRARWEALPESEREAIRAAVKAENPSLARWPNMLEPLYLAELERRE